MNRIGLLLLAVLSSSACLEEGASTDRGPAVPVDWSALREQMVSSIGSGDDGVADARVLAALGKVERHRFVPKDVAHAAYERKPLPIGEAQTISDPYIVGLMSSLLALKGGEKVLEIGTGSGYQSAVLAELVPMVYSIEIRETLAGSARERLLELGYENVIVRCGDGYEGWPEEAPFDAIIVTAAPPEVPEALVAQLAPGGRMVVPVGPQEQNQKMTLIKKDREGRVTRETGTKVWFVPMIRGE